MQYPRQSRGLRRQNKVELTFPVFHPNLTLTMYFSASVPVVEWKDKNHKGLLFLFQIQSWETTEVEILPSAQATSQQLPGYHYEITP